MTIHDHKNIVYMPHEICRLISTQYKIACDGIHYTIYKKYFDSIEDQFKNPHIYSWYCNTVNAYYDLAIYNWSKLFGTYSEPTHYYNLLKLPKQKLLEIGITEIGQSGLKSYLLKQAGLSEQEFNNFHTMTIDYRNRNLAHTENSPEIIKNGDLSYPKLKIVKETLLSSILILIKISKTFPGNKNEINSYEFPYDNFDRAEQICKMIDKSIPHFLDKCKF